MPSLTLAQIKAKGGSVSFQCLRCRHIGRVPMEVLAEQFGWEMTIDQLERLGRCRAAQPWIAGPCGGRSQVWLDLPVVYSDGMTRSC